MTRFIKWLLGLFRKPQKQIDIQRENMRTLHGDNTK